MKQAKHPKPNRFIRSLQQIKKSTWIIIAILFLAGMVRIIDISKESYWVDEILTVRQGQATISTLNLYLKGEMHMPLYIFMSWGWIHAFGISESATRILSAIFGVLSVYIIYLIGKKMFNERTGIYAALLLALSPIAVYYSQEARLYSMFMSLVLLSFYFFISYLESRERKYLIWYIIINIFMLYTDIFALLVLGIHALWTIFRYRKYLKQIAIALIISVASLIPVVMRIALNYSNFDRSDKSWLVPSTDKIILMLMHYSGSILLLITFLIILITGIVMHGLANKAHKEKNFMMLILWAIIPLITVLIISFIQPIFNERYLLFTLPAYILIISFLISKFKDKYQASVMVLIIILSIYALVIQHQTADKDDWRSTAQFLKDNVKDDDYLLITPYYHQESLTYYYNQQCFKEIFMEHCNFVTKNIITINIGQNCCNKDTLVVDNNKLGELLQKNNTLWMIQNREWINNNATPYNYISSQKKLVSKHTFDAGFGSKIEVYEFK